jgi:hypothetical protein
MYCEYRGEFTKKQQYPRDPVILECPVCGSEYRPEQELNGELLAFAGASVDMFSRFRDEELIEELQIRGYKVEKDVTNIVHSEPQEGAEIGTDKVEKIKKLTYEFVKKQEELNRLAEQIDELENE